MGLFSAILTLFTPAYAEPYVVHKDGAMVLDKASGLVWMRCSLGQKWDGKTCAGNPKKYDLGDAQVAAGSFNVDGGMGGYTDWVLPKLQQLLGLVDCRGSAKRQEDGNFWKGRPKEIDDLPIDELLRSYCWGVAPSIGGDPLFAWSVGFGYGYVGSNSRYGSGQVRLVRASQLLGDAVALGFLTKADREQAVQQTLKTTRPRVLAVKNIDALWHVSSEAVAVTVPAEVMIGKTLEENFHNIVAYLVAEEEQKALPAPYQERATPQSPTIERAADLVKGEFETSAAFAPRQAAEKARVDSINQQRQAAYQQAVSVYKVGEAARKNEYEQKLAAAQAANNNPETLRQRVQTACTKALAVQWGNPELKNIRYDADKQELSGKLMKTKQANFSGFDFTIAETLDKAPILKKLLEMGDLFAYVSLRWPNLDNALKVGVELNPVRRDELFAKADTVNKLNDFIAQYPDDDPVVKQAKYKLHEGYLIDYKEAYTGVALRSFIDTYRNNDPDKLVPKARAQLVQVEAKERAEEKKRLAREAVEEKKRIAERKAQDAREKAAEAKRLAYERSPAGQAAEAIRQSAEAIREADRNASRREACSSRARSCEAACIGSGSYEWCIRDCQYLLANCR